MRYYSYWSILDSPSNSIRSNTVLLVVFLVSLILWFLIKKFKKYQGNYEKAILLWFTGIFTVLSLFFYVYLTFFRMDNTEKRIKALLASNQVGKVEGVISNFTRKVEHKKYASVTTESFQVDSLLFEYDDYVLGGFNQFSKTNNGVLQNGLKVRITYQNEDRSIQQIEIEEIQQLK